MVSETDLLPADPLRSKVLFLGLVGKAERIRLLVEARRSLERKLAEIDAYATERPGPYADLAYEAARKTIDARRIWLDYVLLKIAED